MYLIKYGVGYENDCPVTFHIEFSLIFSRLQIPLVKVRVPTSNTVNMLFIINCRPMSQILI